ncbi:MAG: hypothetical protein IJN31_06180 [Peptococcaceae bacterium]|nr:hypothetical protein [Oscillospiraceae bacterium]MBQ7026175.1 hypothetical protein [Peptococcaceae bacterium]
MKKTFALILALVMVLSLAACGKNKDNFATEGNTESSANTTEASSTENSSLDATPNTSDNTADNTTENTDGNAVEGTNNAPNTNASSNPNGNAANNTGSSNTSNNNPPSKQPESHTHKYTSKIIAPTCTAGGYTIYTCACGHSYNANYTNPTNHTYSKKVTAATCTTQGYTTYTCTCGHSYIGDQTQPAGHKYKEATCSQPKTCSVCNKTEGTTVAHVLNTNKVCKWCNQVVAVNPSNFNANIAYTYLGKRYNGAAFGLGGELQDVDCYVWTCLNFQNEPYYMSRQAGVYYESDSPVDGTGYTLPHHHNGKYYYNIAQASWFGGETTYQIVGSEIVVHFASEGEETANTIHFAVLSDGTLKVTAIYGYDLPEKAKIPVGAIFYPNDNPYPQRHTY